MCEPISWTTAAALAGAAASAAGTAITAMNSSASADAQNRANQEAAARASAQRRAEQARQDALTEQRTKAWQAQLDTRSPDAFQQTADQQANQIIGDQQRLASAFTATLPGQDRAPVEVQQDIGRQIAGSTQAAQKRIRAMAQIAGQDAVGVLNGGQRSIYEADASLDRAAAKRSLNLYGVESQPTQPTVIDGGLGSLASTLSGVGNLGLRYAGSQGAFGGGTTSSTTSSTNVGRA